MSELSWDEEEALEESVIEEERKSDPESCMEGGWNASEHCRRCPSRDFCYEAYHKNWEGLIKGLKG